ncbi:MAG: DUF4173 domain-containing protein [Eubacteriales bacterium]|nr:DUF4173 domain-containing protein [Eubacteriales bacterium]
MSEFPKTEPADRLFAAVYLVMGYGFVYLFSSSFAPWGISAFTVFYGAAVLLYLWAKELKPAKESWFWLLVMLSVGIPLGFYSAMPLLQTLILMGTAAYWTLAAAGRLLDGGKTSRWVFFDCWNALGAVPFLNFGCQAGALFAGAKEKDGHRGSAGAVLLGIVIALPVLCVLLPLLSSADMGFERLIGGLAEWIQRHLLAIFFRILFAVPVSFYLFGLVFGGIHGRNTGRMDPEKLREAGSRIRIVPDAAVCTALTVICLVYVLFIGLQGNYLFSAMAGRLPAEFTYAEYARRGFFELCQAGVWNMFLLTAAGLFSQTDSRTHGGLRIVNVLLSALTLLLILAAAGKMAMYMSAYGLTCNRILPMVFMIWMAVVFVCQILRQWKTFPMVRICVLTGAVLFALLCVLPIEALADLYNLRAGFGTL